MVELTRTILFVRTQSRQNRRTLQPDGIKSVRIKAEDLQDRRSHLSGLHETSDGAGTNVRRLHADGSKDRERWGRQAR